MKKEIFDKLVNTIASNKDWYSTYKITNKEGFEVHTFGYRENKSLDEAKALFKEKGYKGEEVYNAAKKLAYESKLDNTYYTLLYNFEKDKISIGTFTTGYKYAAKKERFYPMGKKVPVLAWTKHIYSFTRCLKNKRSPRILLGPILGIDNGVIDKTITSILYNINYNPQLWISYRHYINTKNDWEALDNYTGSKIPEVLKHYKPDVLLALYKSLKDYKKVEAVKYYIQDIHFIIKESRNKPFSLFNLDHTYDLANKLTVMHYDMFVLLISNKITEQEYQNVLDMSNSSDEENVTIAHEIIKFKLEDGCN